MTSVVIAGAGPGASVLAVQLRRRGMDVVIVAPLSRPIQRGIEAVNERGIHLMDEAGMRGALERAGVVIARGFYNGWNQEAPSGDDGRYAYVERSALALQMRTEAAKLGVELRNTGRLGPIVMRGQRLSLIVDRETVIADAAVDASGRSAVWSRPTMRRGHAVATLFEGPGSARPRGGRVARLSQGWAYCLSHPQVTTVGVVGASLAQPTLPSEVAVSLGLPSTQTYCRIGRRPAFVQWAKDPVRGRVLAIGDAALAYDPVAGQGLSFAAASSMAAAAVLRSWLEEPESAALATNYYRDLVDEARRRHLHHLDGLYQHPSERPLQPELVPYAVDSLVCFGGRRHRVGLRQADAIIEDSAYELADGGMARWVGSFDLNLLEELARRPITVIGLARHLAEHGLSAVDAERLIDWSLRKHLLRRIDAPTNGDKS